MKLLCPNIMLPFIVSFFHRKLIAHQQHWRIMR